MSPAILAPAPRAALVDLVGLLLTALALVVAFKLTRPAPVIPVTDLPATTCDLQYETCRLTLSGGMTLEVRIFGGPVRPNQPFVVEARSNGGFVPLALAIRGVEIGMSSPLQAFQPDGKGDYRAQAVLPVCTVSRMTWEVSVVLEAKRERLRWPLLFATESPWDQSGVV